MTDVLVPDVDRSAEELARRTIRRTDWVSCNAAFIDCRTPGSDRKENYAFIGAGVSQNADQFVNLTELHGYNVGAAGMPNGVTNNLHLHFTAEVFINFGGTFRLRWGVDGKQGEYVSHDGDVITVPTWIFRGFTNEGPDDGILLTVLGHDVTGGIIWGPSVLREAESYGLHLTADSRLIDTVAGDELPTDVPLIKPMKQRYIDELTTYTRRGDAAAGDPARRPRLQPRSLLCADLPGGGAELALGIGYGMSEDRRQVPRVHEPHSFNLAWLRAAPGEGVLRHRHDQTQVLTVKSGRLGGHPERGRPGADRAAGGPGRPLGPGRAAGAPSRWSRPARTRPPRAPASCWSSTAATGGSGSSGLPRSSTPPSRPAGCSTRTATWPRWR